MKRSLKALTALGIALIASNLVSAAQIESGFPKAGSFEGRTNCDGAADCTKGRIKAVLFANYDKVAAIAKDFNRLKDYVNDQAKETYVKVPGERPLVYVKVQIFPLYTKDVFLRYTITETADSLKFDFVNECAPNGDCGSMSLNRGFVVFTKLADGAAVGVDYALSMNANLPSIIGPETKRNKMLDSLNFYVKTLEKLANN